MFILTKSADPDETPRFAASNLGLRYLYMFFFACNQPVPQLRTLNVRLSSNLLVNSDRFSTVSPPYIKLESDILNIIYKQ